MNYYIRGNKEKADQIKAAFEKLGYDTAGWNYKSDRGIYFTNESDKSVEHTSNEILANLIKTHPDCKELELPIQPKFKVGDWIVRGEGFVYEPSLITEIRDYYICELPNGERVTYTLNDVHKNFHLWTIQDAKDGDVLAINWHEDNDSWEKIIIFKNYHAKGVKGLIKQPCVEGYGNTFKNGKLAFREEVPYYSRTWTDNLQPATKEQRNILFQQMKENGCEWDVEKKELRNIINPKFKVGDEIKTGNTIDTVAEVDHAARRYYCESGRTISFVNQDLWKLDTKPHYDIKNFYAGMPVLVRWYNTGRWRYSLYSFYEEDSIELFDTVKGSFTQCIPFNDDTKHLLGTTDMPDEIYINW